MSEDSRNIYQRINAVMKRVKYVQKDRQVGTGHQSYKAVTHDQVISVARDSLVENGIVVCPHQLDSEMIITRDLKQDIKMHLYSANYNINFVNIDNAEDKIEVRINAQAADNGDKAPGKCITYATKAAILKVLCLETGENDESREEERDKSNTIDNSQYTDLASYCLQKSQNGEWFEWSEVGLKISAAYSINELSQLPKSKFNEVLELCKSYAGN